MGLECVQWKRCRSYSFIDVLIIFEKVSEESFLLLGSPFLYLISLGPSRRLPVFHSLLSSLLPIDSIQEQPFLTFSIVKSCFICFPFSYSWPACFAIQLCRCSARLCAWRYCIVSNCARTLRSRSSFLSGV